MSRIRIPVKAIGLAASAVCAGLAWMPVARAQQTSGSSLTNAPPPPSFSGGGLRGGLSANDPTAGDNFSPPDPDAASLPPPPVGTANYGRPRPRPDPRLKYPGRARRPAHPLPDLTTYPSATKARDRGAPQSPPGPTDQLVAPPPQQQPPPTVAIVPPIPRKAPPRVDATPYAPVGIGVGGLRLTPYVEVDTGYDSNPNRIETPDHGSWTLRGETGLAVASDWSNHSLTGAASFGYTRYLSEPDADRPDGQGKFDLKLDVTRDTTADFEVRGNLSTQRPGTPGIGVDVINRPTIATFGASAGVTHGVSALQFGLHGAFDRVIYQNGQLSDGTTIDLANGNYNQFGALPRLAYQLTPGLIPFVEGTFDTRQRDQALDTLGFARDSNGQAARVGTTFELTRVFTGQAAVGFARREYADTRLGSISAPTFDASLIWAATPLTTVSVRGSTSINETTVTGSAGYVTHAGSLEISHALLRNLTLGAVASVGVNDYAGVDLREVDYSGTIKLDYNLTRELVVRGSFTNERLQSTAPGSDYTANTFLLGLRLQR